MTQANEDKAKEIIAGFHGDDCDPKGIKSFRIDSLSGDITSALNDLEARKDKEIEKMANGVAEYVNEVAVMSQANDELEEDRDRIFKLSERELASLTTLVKEKDAEIKQLKLVLDNPTPHILRTWDRDKVVRFADHLVGKETP